MTTATLDSAEPQSNGDAPVTASAPPAARTDSRAPAAAAHPPGRRSAKELLAATKVFQEEKRAQSWFHVVESFGVWAALLAVTVVAPFWWIKAIASVVAGLVVVRMFILYHDYMHLAILRNSTLAKVLFYSYGVYVLTPPVVWRQTHNYHHANTAKIVGSHVGSYLMVTTDMWKNMSAKERRMYKVIRHPLNIFFAFFTAFAIGMCISPFLRNPRKNWDSIFALLLSIGVSVALIAVFGTSLWFFTYFLPLFVATMVGAYLFYAQHNFPEINVQPRESWEYTRAAIESSSYMKLGPIMNWFTGNIGYHHVHHLNPGIPFYRLPEAMAGIPELQSPLGTTSLSPSDIVACFRVKLWDTEQGKMVGYPAGT